MKDQSGNYFKNKHEMYRAQGFVLVGNETFPVEDVGKFVFQVCPDPRAGYEMPSDCTPGTEAEAEADRTAWLESYPDADCRVVEIA